MPALQSITITDDPTTFLVRFRKADGEAIDVSMQLDARAASSVTASPDLLALGRWRDANDLRAVLVPAVQAFAAASAKLELEDM